MRLILLENLTHLGKTCGLSHPRLLLSALALPGSNTEPERSAVLIVSRPEDESRRIVQFSHRDILAVIARAIPALQVNPDERVLTAVSTIGPFELSLGILLPMLSGHRLFVVAPRCSAHRAAELIYDTDATIVVANIDAVQAWVSSATRHDFYRTHLILTPGCVTSSQLRAACGDRFALRLIGETELDAFRHTEVFDDFRAEGIC